MSQSMALRNIGANFESYKQIEIDKYAVASANAVFNLGQKPQDICQVKGKDLEIVDKERYEYIMFYSFPCTDISYAGLQKGMTEGSGTSSSLLWEVKRILLELKDNLPQTLIMENVKALVGKKNMPQFKIWLDFLKSIGYKTTWKVLNTKDFGIPQNRERVFAISFLDHNRNYTFPSPIPLKTTLKELLEQEVGEEYYIKNDKAKRLIEELLERYTLDDFLINETNLDKKKIPVDLSINKPEIKEISNCITTRENRGISNHCMEGNRVVDLTLQKPSLKIIANCVTTKDRSIQNRGKEGNGIVEIKQIGNLIKNNRNNPSPGRVYSVDGLSPTLTCMNGGGHRQPFIVVAMRGRYKENPSLRVTGLPTEQRLEPNTSGCVNTITSVQKDSLLLTYEFRLRKLTPRECLRLQGVKDEDIDKMEKVNSKTQLYKQAGNSITVNVLEAIFRQLGIKVNKLK